MTNHILHSLKAIAKGFLGSMVLGSMVCVVMLFSVTQTAAFAASFHDIPQAIVVLGAVDTMPDESFSQESLSQESLSEKREQRREWQSRVSGTRESSSNTVDDETLRERFNIDEITETMKDNLNIDEDADAKAAQSYRPSR